MKPGFIGSERCYPKMPSIQWHEVFGHPLPSLKIVIKATILSLKETIARIILPFKPRTQNLRNAIARAWLGYIFVHCPTILYSKPRDTDLQEVQEAGLHLYIIQGSEKSKTQLKDADAVILFAHGGGMIFGHPLQYLSDYRRWISGAKRLRKKLDFVAVQYRKCDHLK
jgi:hypothetical protein